MNWENYKPYFKKDKFMCKCGCGKNNMNERTMSMLMQARTDPDIVAAGIVFIIISGSRCPVHNKLEGGKDNSSHLEGYAFDIYAANNYERYMIHEALRKAGFKRFGFGRTFIHGDSDTRPSKSQKRIWLYN